MRERKELTKYPRITTSQAVIMLIVSKMFTLFAYNPMTYSLGAVDTAIGIIISSVINIIIFFPFILINQEKEFSLYENTNVFAKVLMLVLFCFSVFICVECITQFDFFMSSTIYLGVSPIVFIVPTLLISLFICTKGIETIARVSGIIFVGILICVVIVSISLINVLDFSVMDLTILTRKGDLFKYILNNVFNSLELIPIILIVENIKGKIKKGIVWYGVVTGIFFEVVLFFVSAVLGEYRKEISFPFYTLSAIAKNSVTDRFSSLFLVLLIFVSAIRLCLYLYSAGMCLKAAFSKIKNVYCFFISSLIILIFSFVTTSNILYLEDMFKFIGSGIILISIIIVSVILKIISSKGEKYEKS